MSVTIKKKTVSPAMAKAWMDKRAPNRHVRAFAVSTLLTYMSRKQFLDTGDPIKFNVKGDLIDGQHRLSALIEYGQPIEMWIAEGVESEAMPILDIGSPRKPNDTLDIYGKIKNRGWKNSAARASTLRMLASYERSNGKFMIDRATGPGAGGSGRITRFELIAAAEKYKNIDESIQVGVGASKILRMGCSVYAAVHYLFSRVDKEAADSFFSTLITGDLNGCGGNPRVLREQIIAFGLAGKRMSGGEMAYRLIRTWNATRRGEKLSKVQLPKDMKQMLLPEIE